jgi:hypothetical protein
MVFGFDFLVGYSHHVQLDKYKDYIGKAAYLQHNVNVHNCKKRNNSEKVVNDFGSLWIVWAGLHS